MNQAPEPSTDKIERIWQALHVLRDALGQDPNGPVYAGDVILIEPAIAPVVPQEEDRVRPAASGYVRDSASSQTLYQTPNGFLRRR